MSTFGARLRAVRHERGLTQKAVCTELGLALSSMSELETGESKYPDARTLLKMAAFLKVRPEWLVFGDLPQKATTVAPRNDTERDLLALIQSAPLEALSVIYATSRGIIDLARGAEQATRRARSGT